MVKRSIILVFLLIAVVSVKADIGETFDLMKQREQLLKENEALLNGRNIDSLSSSENSLYIENLHIVRLIDEDIFKSQKTTIDRIGDTLGGNRHANKSIALLCFLLALAFSLSMYMIYLLNRELNSVLTAKKTLSERVSEFFSLLLINFQADPRQRKDVAVNRFIIFGMFCMFISVLGYLLATLGV